VAFWYQSSSIVVLSVYLLVTIVNSGKTTDLIEMFGWSVECAQGIMY